MEIQTALDWNKVSTDLHSQLRSVGYNPDLKKMFDNIDNMVKELSKAEVRIRRSGNAFRLNDQLDQINKSIKHLEHYLLMAKLMR
jgi:hypothetical protein